jgi:hypothetical protein
MVPILQLKLPIRKLRHLFASKKRHLFAKKKRHLFDKKNGHLLKIVYAYTGNKRPKTLLNNILIGKKTSYRS